MKRKAARRSFRRRPVQRRAQMTVDAMLDAAVKLLKRGGAASITTNRIADTAGVSIGSVYQYFPNKHALFIALHERHIKQVEGTMRRKIAESADGSLECLIQSMVEGMVETHEADPELSLLLQSEVPHRADGATGFATRMQEAIRTALAPHIRGVSRRADLNAQAFIVANLVESLGHAIVLARPRSVTLRQAQAECSKAILAYVRS